MPFGEVLGKFKRGELHSGSKSGRKVTKKKQAVAIMMSEKRKAEGGKREYMKHGGMVGMEKYHAASDKKYKKMRGKKRGFASIR